MRRAFTLLELLVVVGIVAVLTGVLLPVVGSVRENARTVKCLSNLRQLAAAAQAYCARNEESYPPAYGFAGSAYTAWDFSTVWDPTLGKVRIEPGWLWKGETVTEVQQCPSFEGFSSTAADPFTGYNYNTSYVGRGQYETVSAPARVPQVRNPARCALFGDGQYAGGANKFMRSPVLSRFDADFLSRSAGTQGFRHRGRTNVVFCDGHADTVGDRFTATSDTTAPAPGTGFLSADNSLYSGES